MASPRSPGHHQPCNQANIHTLLGKQIILQNIMKCKKHKTFSTILTRFSISVRANMYVLILLFWWSNVYKRRVAWSDVCCSQRAVYKLLKLIWKACGIDEGKGLLSGIQKTQNFLKILHRYFLDYALLNNKHTVNVHNSIPINFVYVSVFQIQIFNLYFKCYLKKNSCKTQWL